MDMDEKDLLAEIAENVAAGESIDWDALAESNPALADSIQSLRRIETLGAACRKNSLFAALEDLGAAGQSVLPRTWGSLHIIERIGEGSFGEVLRARDPILQRDVALKLRRALNEEERVGYQHHLSEARRLARVRHPNVLPIHGVEIHDGRPGMWTELVEGVTLEAALTSEGPFPAESIVEIALQLSQAIRAVHESGLVHGDIKTENVMRRKDGQILLMDFGAGRDRPTLEAGLDSDAAQGTPISMAPELLRGRPPTIQSDLYALGVLLFRLATGRNPIEADSFVGLLEKVELGDRVPLGEMRPGLPTPLTSAIDRLIAPIAEDRPENTGEFEAGLSLGLDLVRNLSQAEISERTHGVPRAAGPLIGRRRELQQIHGVLPTRRLVTLVGLGGSGKTRLAQEVARLLAVRYSGGCWWVDLVEMDGSDVESREGVARGLGLRDRPGVSAIELIRERVGEATALLILDNAEHVLVESRQLVDELLETCPRLHVLITSRSALGTDREVAVPVLPFESPPARSQGLEVSDFDSVRFFVDRAHAARPGFALTAEDAPSVADICRRLEGIPLAVELAAARVRVMSVQEIARRLEQGLSLVMSQSAGGDRHHATLRASIEWSYLALTDAERELLERLSVFRGGWTVQAAEAVCFESERPEHPELIDSLGGLVDSSLALFEPGVGARPDRYRLLEIVRNFAATKSEGADPTEELRLRHLRFFREQAEEGKERLRGPDQAEWAERLELDFANFEHALAFSPTGEIAATDTVRLASSLAYFWDLRGMITLGIRHARRILESPETGQPTEHRGSLLTSLGILLYLNGQSEESLATHEASRELNAAIGNKRGVAGALSNIGMTLSGQGDLAGARESTDQALAIMEEIGDEVGIALDLNLLGGYDLREGDYEAAIKRFERGLEIHRGLGDHAGVALIAFNIGAVLHNLGRNDEAELQVAESLAIRRRVGDLHGTAKGLSLLGYIDLAREEPEVALERAREALAIWRDAETPPGICEGLELAGMAAEKLGRDRLAARLYAAVVRNREQFEETVSESREREWHARQVRLAERLGQAALRRALAEGAAMNLEEATASALEVPTRET